MIRKYILPAAAIVFGGIGAFLRRRELTAAFDEAGLPTPGQPVTIALIVLTLAVIAASAAFAFLNGKKNSELKSFSGAFGAGLPEAAIACILAACASVCGVLLIGERSGAGTADRLLGFGAAASGISMLVIALLSYTRKYDLAAGLLSIIPSAAFALWMALTYRDYAGSPSIILYAYLCAAFGAAALFFCYTAGFAFGRPAPRAGVLFGLVSAYLLILIAPETGSLAERLYIAATALYITLANARLIGSLNKKEI